MSDEAICEGGRGLLEFDRSQKILFRNLMKKEDQPPEGVTGTVGRA